MAEDPVPPDGNQEYVYPGVPPDKLVKIVPLFELYQFYL